jgi:hypothetical protein
MVYLPSGVDDLVRRMRVEETPCFTVVGRNVAVAPDGTPVARKVTSRVVLATRFVAMVRIVSFTVFPRDTDRVAEEVRTDELLTLLTWAWGAAASETAGLAAMASPAIAATRRTRRRAGLGLPAWCTSPVPPRC